MRVAHLFAAASLWLTPVTRLAQALADKNIPVFATSGDDGASDNDVGNNVDYPASSPNAFGCGGTTIAANGKLETAWSYWGGGISAIFPTPSWQVRLHNSDHTSWTHTQPH